MILLYSLAGLAAFFVLGNILLKIMEKEKAQLTFNALILISLAVNIYLLSGAGTTALNLFAITPFSMFFALIFTMGFLLTSLLAYEYAPSYSDFALLGSFALIGMYTVATSSSLLTIFLGLELTSLPTCFIVLLSKRSSIEAAAKLFIMLSVAIATFSFASVLFYGSANTMLLKPQSQSGLLALASMLFIASLGFEASVFPFNVLLPDVYQGSSAYATAMLGGINKKVGFAALIQILILLLVSTQLPFQVIAALSLLTMLYGNLVALVQENFKRMLAYSSISQAGYILIGMAARSTGGINASLFQIFAHMFAFIGILAIVAWLERKNRSEMNDLIGLYKENRLLAFGLSFLMLSLIGVPLTAGFFGKFLLFLSAVHSGMLWLAVLGVVNSVISVFYYAKALTAVYTNKFGARSVSIGLPTTAVVVACIALILIFGIYPQPLLNMTSAAAQHLFS